MSTSLVNMDWCVIIIIFRTSALQQGFDSTTNKGIILILADLTEWWDDIRCLHGRLILPGKYAWEQAWKVCLAWSVIILDCPKWSVLLDLSIVSYLDGSAVTKHVSCIYKTSLRYVYRKCKIVFISDSFLLSRLSPVTLRLWWRTLCHWYINDGSNELPITLACDGELVKAGWGVKFKLINPVWRPQRWDLMNVRELNIYELCAHNTTKSFCDSSRANPRVC